MSERVGAWEEAVIDVPADDWEAAMDVVVPTVARSALTKDMQMRRKTFRRAMVSIIKSLVTSPEGSSIEFALSSLIEEATIRGT